MPVGIMEPLKGSNLRPMADLPGGGQAEIGGDRVWNLGKPEVPMWKSAAAGLLGGPRLVDHVWDREDQRYKGEVATFIADQLLNGRPPDKPIHPQELTGLVGSINPALVKDRQFMGGVGLWVKMWNDEVESGREFAAKRAENMYNSGKEQNALLTAQERSDLYDHGWFTRNMGQPFATAPGMTDAPAGTHAKSSAKSQLFTGWLPGPAQREAEKIQVTAGPEAWKAGLTAQAQQEAQTSGHAARRKVDQQMPPGVWAERIDPQTGMKTKVWTGGLNQVALGREPFSVADQKAQVLAKAMSAAAGGQDPRAVLNPIELQVLESALKSGELTELLRFFEESIKRNKAAGDGKQPAGGQAASSVQSPYLAVKPLPGEPGAPPSQAPAQAAPSPKDPNVVSRIREMKAKGIPASEIRRMMSESKFGINPELYAEELGQ